MFEIVALSGSERCFTPSPVNSTNFPTTSFSLSISVTARTRSVAVIPGLGFPTISNPTTSGKSMYMGCPSITASASIPPTPQPRTPKPLIIVVCESVPTTVSGKNVLSESWTTSAIHSRLTWWTIPLPGGTTLNFSTFF